MRLPRLHPLLRRRFPSDGIINTCNMYTYVVYTYIPISCCSKIKPKQAFNIFYIIRFIIFYKYPLLLHVPVKTLPMAQICESGYSLSSDISFALFFCHELLIVTGCTLDFSVYRPRYPSFLLLMVFNTFRFLPTRRCTLSFVAWSLDDTLNILCPTVALITKQIIILKETRITNGNC